MFPLKDGVRATDKLYTLPISGNFQYYLGFGQYSTSSTRWLFLPNNCSYRKAEKRDKQKLPVLTIIVIIISAFYFMCIIYLGSFMSNVFLQMKDCQK